MRYDRMLWGGHNSPGTEGELKTEANQTQNISDERLEELFEAHRWCALAMCSLNEEISSAEAISMARELIQARSDLADVEDLLPAPAGPYQTMGERTKLLKDQGEYAQEMCGDAVKLLEAAQDEFTALRASHKRLVRVLTALCDIAKNALLPKTIRRLEFVLANARKLERE